MIRHIMQCIYSANEAEGCFSVYDVLFIIDRERPFIVYCKKFLSGMSVFQSTVQENSFVFSRHGVLFVAPKALQYLTMHYFGIRRHTQSMMA